MTGLYHIITGLIEILILVGLALITFSHFAARRHFARKNSPGVTDPLPKVSILKPVEGTGPETYAAFASFCRLNYSGEIEIRIGTINSDDPAVAMTHRLQQEFPNHDIKLIFAPLQGTNRKTSIMETLWRNASGQFLFFSDADVFAPADYLTQLVPLLTQANVGCLTCLPRGIQACNAGGQMIALHYGYNYLPQWMLAMRTTGIHWAIGHTMALPRSVLEKLNGFMSFQNHLADDYELGNRVSKLGLRVIVPPLLMDCVMPDESFGESFVRMLRWKRTIRRSRGFEFLGVIITYPVFWAMVLVLCQPLAWWSLTMLGLVIMIRWSLAAALQPIIKMPDWSRGWWMLPVVDIVEGITFFGAYFGGTIFWAGRRYTLGRDGTLTPAAAEIPAIKN